MKAAKIRREVGIRLKGVARTARRGAKTLCRVLYVGPKGKLVNSEKLIIQTARAAGYGCLKLPSNLWRLLPHAVAPAPDWGTPRPLGADEGALVEKLRRKTQLLEVLLALPPARLRDLPASSDEGPDMISGGAVPNISWISSAVVLRRRSSHGEVRALAAHAPNASSGLRPARSEGVLKNGERTRARVTYASTRKPASVDSMRAERVESVS